jgi:spore coat polysaccharide biosynthesis predicted glycosyltransferase SpsG
MSSQFSPNKETDILILDSYTIDKDDSFINPFMWRNVIAIIDSATPEYECSLRIHPGLDSDWFRERNVPILYGPAYIPLRKAISLKKTRKEETSGPLNIIISSGGTDSFGLVSTLAKVLNETSLDFKASLFTNSQVPENLDYRFEVVEIGPEIDLHTQSANLVFTTASTSSLEFIASGLPVAIISVADNQETYYKKLGELGIAAQVGRRKNDGTWELSRSLIEELVYSSDLRRKLSSAATNFIDSNGASRIVNAINGL